MRTSLLPAERRQPPGFLLCNGLLAVLNLRRQQSSLEGGSQLAKCLAQTERYLPKLSGKPLSLELLPELSVARGKLLSKAAQGTAVYAGSFIRQRRIVLETGLLLEPELFRAILVHELFHFVWVRLSSSSRRSFAIILENERNGRARGELGVSASVAKDRREPSIRHWKHYVCESFCDTAGYVFTGLFVGPCVSLSERRIKTRRDWFASAASDEWKI